MKTKKEKLLQIKIMKETKHLEIGAEKKNTLQKKPFCVTKILLA